MFRLGLCCMFAEAPINFRTTTATAMSRRSRDESLANLSSLCLSNAVSLLKALEYCKANGIGCFRVLSQILPLKTHPSCGYRLEELPYGERIVKAFKVCREFARANYLRLSFHPDQFVVLNSPRPEVVTSSLAELEYQAEVAEWVGADVVNIHGGGAYGDKLKAMEDFRRNLARLSVRARKLLTVENDDKIFTPSDLLPMCQAEGVPLVYDVHHHRCLKDGLTVEEATQAALATWNREPMMHLSSPIEGWTGPKPERHHDYIDVTDFPACWLGQTLTVEVEAKAKELAVLKLKTELDSLAPPKVRGGRRGAKR
jgi:UV DNA damage endonuclease